MRWALVFRNPQSILCGLIAGLMFIPTTIFDMVWGVRFLQEAHGFDYAVGGDALGGGALRLDHRLSAARVVSDRIGRRKPVIIGGGAVLLACLAWILYGPAGVFRPTCSASSPASPRAPR